MSSRKTKKGPKLGSSRRYKNRDRENEERENDDGFQDPENEPNESEQSQFLPVSGNQLSNEPSQLNPEPVIACTNPDTSVMELSLQSQSHDFRDIMGQADVTSKHRKMGSTRKGKRSLKYEGLYEDEPDHQVQFYDEQGMPVDASIKKDEDKKDRTTLLVCAPSQTFEHESSSLQEKHLTLGTTVQNADLHNNKRVRNDQDLEAVQQRKLMDISSSELNISEENSSVTPNEFILPQQELNKSRQICNKIITFSEPAPSLSNTASQIDTAYTPLNGNREEGHGVQMSENSLIQIDKPYEAEKTVDDLNCNITDKHEDTEILVGLSNTDIRQDEFTEVQSTSLINEHEQETEENVATVKWENVGTEDATRSEHLHEHKDKQLTEESIYKFESTEFIEDNDNDKKLCAAVARTDHDSGERVAAENIRQATESDTNIISPLNMEEETSLAQVVSYDFKFQGDGEIKCYREKQNDLHEAKCSTEEIDIDEEMFQEDMHYEEEKTYGGIGAEKEVENNDMQSAHFAIESELDSAKTLCEETETNSETYILQHNNPEDVPSELEAGDCSYQMLSEVIKNASDIEIEVIEKEQNDTKEEINAGSTESFTMEDVKGVDDVKVSMSTFIDESEIASLNPDIQEYAITGHAPMVVNEYCAESPNKGSASLVHAYTTSDLVEHIPETHRKLGMQVYCPIALADHKQSMSEEFQVNPLNIDSEASLSQGQGDSLAENVRFSLSEKNEIDSTLSGLNLASDQKDCFETIKETTQAQSLDKSTPNSEDGPNSCYPQSSESLTFTEAEAEQMDENVIKAVVKNQSINNSQEQHETSHCISTELMNTNQECSVVTGQDGETVMVENVIAVLDTTHVVLSEGGEHLVDTEDFKRQSVTEVVENLVQSEEEATSTGNKDGQPKSFKDPYQNIYPDLNIEQSKSLEGTEIFTGTINADYSTASAEPADETEVVCLQDTNTLQATSTPIHMLISTNICGIKMGSTQRNLAGKEKEQDKEEDICGEEKDMYFTERSLLGLENGVSVEKKNNRREEMNAGPTENFTMEAKCTKHYMHSEISSQNFQSIQTTIKHLSPATEHPDFKEDDGSSRESVKNRNTEILTQTRTKKKKKFGSTRKPHGRHQLPTEEEEGEDKDLENIDEIEHQIKTQAATLNPQTEPLNTMSQVTRNIQDSPVSTEQKLIISPEVETGTRSINKAPAKLSVETDQTRTVISDAVISADGLTNSMEQNKINQVNEEKDDELLNEQQMSPVITKIQEDALIVHGSLEVKMPSNKSSDHECLSEVNVHSTCENVQNRSVEIHMQTQTKKKKKFGSARRPHGRDRPLAEREEGEDLESKWNDLENTDEIEHQIITQAATANLLIELQNTMNEVTFDIHDSPVTSEQKQSRIGQNDATPAVLPVDVDQTYPVVSDKVSNAQEPTDIPKQNDKPGVHKASIGPVSLAVQMHINAKLENEHANKVNDHPICGPVELIPEAQVTSDMQINTEDILTVVSVHNQNITEEQLKNPTNTESEPEQLESTSTFIQIEETTSSQADLNNENVQLSSSEESRASELTPKLVMKESENIQEHIMDQNVSKTGLIKEDNNGINEEINDASRENFTQEAISTQQYVLCDLSAQSADHGLTTIDHPSLLQHPGVWKDDRNSKENVDKMNADTHTQIHAKKKKKFGSTRKPHGRHQLPTEEEEGEDKDQENIEEIEHQIKTQAATLNPQTEPLNTMSQVTRNIQDSPVSTEQKLIISPEVETGTRSINKAPAKLSVETDQTRTVISDAVISADGLTNSMEQNKISQVNEEKDDELLNEQQMSPVITKIQEDALIVHGSLEVKMPSNKSSDHECLSEVNVHSTCENVQNRSVEIHMQTQKTIEKFASAQSMHGRQETPSEGEWKDQENTEKIQSIDQARIDMLVASEQYHTMAENPKNRELKPEQCEIGCPVVHIQELKVAPGDIATQNLADRHSGRKKKMGSTRRSLRVMKGKETIQEQTTEESTLHAEEEGAQKETFNSNTEICRQSIQKNFGLLNIIKDDAEERDLTCENIEVKQNREEAWQITTDLNPGFVNLEPSFGDTKTNRQEYEPQIHHKHDKSGVTLLNEIEHYLNKSFESTLTTPALDPNITEFSESVSRQLQSSPNPEIHMEPSSPARRRKMGSSRKIQGNKHAGFEQEKENLNESNVTNTDSSTDAKTDIETIMAEGTEDMTESVKLTSEVQVLSQINESSAQDTGQLPEDRQQFGSRWTAKACSEHDEHDEYESNQKKTEIQVSKSELKVSDPSYISEPSDTLICPPVHEPRPKLKRLEKMFSHACTEDGIVSCNSIRKSIPSAVNRGGKQWDGRFPDFEQAVYNIVMVGNSNVGKTSFMKWIQSGHFIPDYSATIGVDTFVHTVTFGSRTVKLYMWDTAGQERYHSITTQVFHKAQGLLLMYDITSSQSFHAVRAWISQVQEQASSDVIIMLLGNKNDCAHREVQLKDGEDLSKEYNIHFMECSAATGENVSESLKTLAWLLVKQRVRKEEEHITLQPKPQNKKSGCC